MYDTHTEHNPCEKFIINSDISFLMHLFKTGESFSVTRHISSNRFHSTLYQNNRQQILKKNWWGNGARMETTPQKSLA
jgi:hypothetical protein